MSLNVGSDGMGSWGYTIIQPLLARTFPNTIITYDQKKPFDFVIRSHFQHIEPTLHYSCPYITWSGEAYRVRHRAEYKPLFEINTAYYDIPNSIYFPHLVTELMHTARSMPHTKKNYCCAFAFSNRVSEREHLFLGMRRREPTCYSFGQSVPTRDNPFTLARGDRANNGDVFKDHGFGYVVAMENRIAPGYITEKIGHAFLADSVPIYWGDSSAISEMFNPASFINVLDYPTIDKAAETAVNIWRDPQKYQKYLDAPITLNNKLADYEAVYTEYRPWQKLFVDTLRDTFPDLS
jgi:hypothetical protein